MTDMDDQTPGAFNQRSLYDSPDPPRVIGPPADKKPPKALTGILVLLCVLVLGGFAWFVAGTLGDEEQVDDYEAITPDATARFHERTADLFDEGVTTEQREAVGRAVCEFTDRSTDPRTVRQHFEATYPEADFPLLFDASVNAWCPEHAGLLARG